MWARNASYFIRQGNKWMFQNKWKCHWTKFIAINNMYIFYNISTCNLKEDGHSKKFTFFPFAYITSKQSAFPLIEVSASKLPA